MRLKNPADLASDVIDDANSLAAWYTEKLLFTSPSVTYSTIGLTYYGLGYSLGRWITGPGIGGRAGGAIAMKLWRDMQVSLLFTAARYAAPIGVASAVVGASYGISKATTNAYSKFEPQNPNEKTSFWQGFGATLAGGFSMGGGIDLS